ncbi:porin family protein [Celerinatantimonas yamalensis]|uniref:Porin family protein n=1 Tax=Celerinatantimonas yamalensis TaxID=559956 RepID=A0ABW9G9M2_9GAMM
MALMLGAFPVAANAAWSDIQPQPYVGVQLSSQHLKDSSDSLNFGTVTLLTGVNINSFLALEARYGKSFNDNEINGVKLSIQSYYGAYLKLGVPTGSLFTPYAIVGKTWEKFKGEESGQHGTASLNDISWGLGVQAAVSRHSAVAVEYMNLSHKDQTKVTSIGINVNYVF